jgi:hypothetical protein
MEMKESLCVEALLPDFLHCAKDDPRIGPSHISVYTALVTIAQQCKQQPVSFYGRDLMRLAKISNRTYHQCMQELHRFRYIQYIPSFNPALGSVVWFVNLK